MKMIISLEQFNTSKSALFIPLECEFCHKIFYRAKGDVKRAMLGKKAQINYCSVECRGKTQTKKGTVKTSCLNCNAKITKTLHKALKIPNHFCSSSCAATYNNKHKTYGYRRSKLEQYFEEQITFYYPQLLCLYNNKETIGSELDFYFPTLKLAVELNGIFHYEPIYGKDQFEKIQNNDKQKSIRCYELGIEFCSIDASKCKHLTQQRKDEYWNILEHLIKQVLTRNM